MKFFAKNFTTDKPKPSLVVCQRNWAIATFWVASESIYTLALFEAGKLAMFAAKITQNKSDTGAASQHATLAANGNAPAQTGDPFQLISILTDPDANLARRKNRGNSAKMPSDRYGM